MSARSLPTLSCQWPRPMNGLFQEPLSSGPRGTETLCGGLCRFALTTAAPQASTHQQALPTIQPRAFQTLASGPAAPAVAENTVQVHISGPSPDRLNPKLRGGALQSVAVASAAELQEPLAYTSSTPVTVHTFSRPSRTPVLPARLPGEGIHKSVALK